MAGDISKFGATAVAHKFTDEQVAASAARLGLSVGDFEAHPDHAATLFADHPDHEVADGGENLITTAGLTRLVSLLAGAGGIAITSTTARLGVGDGAGTAAIGDTDLGAVAGSTHRQFVVMDATYPSVAAAVITLQASFTSALGNFAWNEWGIDIGAATVANGTTVSATLFNHKTSAALGTKSTGTWVLQVTVTES